MAKKSDIKKKEVAESVEAEPVEVTEVEPAPQAVEAAEVEAEAVIEPADGTVAENIAQADADAPQSEAASTGSADGTGKAFPDKLKEFFGKVWAGIKVAACFVWKYLKIAGIAVWNYLKTRWIGFFLLIPVVVLSLIEPAVYASGFFKTEYESVTTYILPFFVLLGFALAFEKHTARYAPVAMFAITLVSLLEFIRTTYMHLSTAFFAGINGNVFVQAGFPFSFCVIALVINLVLCITAMFFKQYRTPKASKSAETELAPAATEEPVTEVGNEQA